MNYLDFEKPLAEIEGKAEELRAMARGNSEMDVEAEAKALDKKAQDILKDLYKNLTPWRKCQVARHPDRPHCRDYINALFTEYTPLAGDRNFADDHAVMGGIARFNDRPVVVIGHEKGNDTKSRIEHNFGMARPEGYRKAVRLMIWLIGLACLLSLWSTHLAPILEKVLRNAANLRPLRGQRRNASKLVCL